MTDMTDTDAVRSFATAEPARRAHDCLLGAAAALGLSAKPERTAIEAVRLYDVKERYLFAWIVNRGHLLFYLRKPARALLPGAGDQAVAELPAGKLTPAGEVTIRIETVPEALAVAAWIGAAGFDFSGRT